MPNKDTATSRPESGLWKDKLDRSGVMQLAESMARVYDTFDADVFVRSVFALDYDQLELKGRIGRLADTLGGQMPADYRKAASLLVKMAPEVRGFGNWVLTAYVEKFGLDYPSHSLAALRELTKRGSSEFAIRPFIIKHQKETMPVLLKWAEDKNEHVRRLAAEGTRPRGVWTQHIEQFRRDPKPVIALLEKLKADSSLYVRKAVANNLNDISKDHPEVVIGVATKWARDHNPHTDWIIKHGCRTLIKKGHKKIFPLLGFDRQPKVRVAQFSVSPVKVRIGSSVALTCHIKSQSRSPQKLIVDYRVTFCRAGRKNSSKVFKWREKPLPSSGVVELTTRHKFIDGTTRKHFPGRHTITLLINGHESGSAVCTLLR